MNAPLVSPVGTLPTGPQERGQLRQLVTAGSLRFVLGFDDAREYVDSVSHLTLVPRCPPWLLGMFSADGVAVPLVDVEAWALRRAPAPWRTESVTAASLRTGGAKLSALRMADGTNAWAVRVSQAPLVVDLHESDAQPMTHGLPLAVSAAHGRLMNHAAHIWHPRGGALALQIRWGAVADSLRQELSGLIAKE